MAYQNIYYQREKNLIHLWDDVQGYKSFPHTRYAYEKAENGEYRSIYGDRLTKVYKFEKDDTSLFESDVAETTRALVDLYTDDDEPSVGIKILTLDIEVEMITGLPSTKLAENEITAIGFHDNVSDDYVVLILDKHNVMQKKRTDDGLVVPFKSEIDLLRDFLSRYERIMPHIITGWNIDDFDIPYLFNRIKNVLGEQQANRLSPIGQSFYSPYRNKFFIAGVSCLDYIALYRNYNFGELPNYRLDTVAKLELGEGKLEYTGNLDDLFKTDIDSFVKYNIIDVQLVVKLDKKLKFIDLCRGICHVGHVPYEDFVFSSKYLEGSLLTYLRRKNLVAPNKPHDRKEKMAALYEAGSEKFIGAYVKDPIVGKYDWIYDLDLTSLYPSIIMSLNISPETKVCKISNWNAEKFLTNAFQTYNIGDDTISHENLKMMLEEQQLSISSNGVMYRTDVVGCIPGILDDWFKKRVEYNGFKKKYGSEKNMEKYEFYDKRQLVQKILLNSLYGVLGLPAFRFYDLDNAEAVTTTGQTVIKYTADMVNVKYNNELSTDAAESTTDWNIYIDTDSVFFSAVPLMDSRHPDWKSRTDTEIASIVDGIAGEVQDYLNEFYDVLSDNLFNIKKHRFTIKKEYVAKSGLWVAKKRYAQWIISNNGMAVDKLDVKGLDVRRSSFAKEFSKIMSSVLIDILKGKTEAEITDTIKTFKASMINLPPADIAKNSSVKEMSKYLPKGKRNMFESKKGAPAHVKAAIVYNDLLKHYKCAYNHAPMKDGDKIKWVYLKSNPLGIDAVGFTGYNDPVEITDFISTYIDHDKLFTSDLYNKLQDFYNALKWGDVLSQQKVANQFFSF